LRRALEAGAAAEVAERCGCSRGAVERAAAGLRVLPGTVALIERGLT